MFVVVLFALSTRKSETTRRDDSTLNFARPTGDCVRDAGLIRALDAALERSPVRTRLELAGETKQTDRCGCKAINNLSPEQFCHRRLVIGDGAGGLQESHSVTEQARDLQLNRQLGKLH